MLFAGDAVRGNGLNLLVGVAYYVYFWSAYGHGQTLGNRALSIRVVKTDGSELTITDAFVRYLGLLLSFFCLFIGVIWVAFDANKQGWHDKIANTYVVRA
ncbi:MAG: RDD family protein [Chloroflexota bacterium]|nr:RDD family protein [Chloroflexota bacterium]